MAHGRFSQYDRACEDMTEAIAVGPLAESAEAEEVTVPPLTNYYSSRPDFSRGHTPSRIGYHNVMLRVARNSIATRWPTYKVAKCTVDVCFVKVVEIPEAYNAVRALVLASQFREFPSFRLRSNIPYKVKSVSRVADDLFTFEEYEREGQYCQGTARMHLKNLSIMWEGLEYVEFSFINLVGNNFQLRYKCDIWPCTKIVTYNRQKRVIERMTMHSDTKTTKPDGTETNDRVQYIHCTPGTIRALTFRKMEELQAPNFEMFDSEQMKNGLKMKLGKDEFGQFDKLSNVRWNVTDLQDLLCEHGICNRRYLSAEQWKHALRVCRNGVAFVQGPPGTGKTKVLVVAAAALAQQRKKHLEDHPQPKVEYGQQRSDASSWSGNPYVPSMVDNSVVAVCAKTNKACEVIVDKMRSMCANFVWATSHLRERTVTDPCALHIMAAARLKTDVDFVSWFDHYQQGTDLHRHGGHRKYIRKLKEQMQAVLNSVDIVVCTVQRLEVMKSKHYHLEIVATLIDEATQLDELDMCAAVTMRSHRVAMFGDTQQLGPITVRNREKLGKLPDEEKEELNFASTGWFIRVVRQMETHPSWRFCFPHLLTLYRTPYLQSEFLLRTIYEPWPAVDGNHQFLFKFNRECLADMERTALNLPYQESFSSGQLFFQQHRMAMVNTDDCEGSHESGGRGGISLQNKKEAEIAAQLANIGADVFGSQNVAVIAMYAEQVFCIEQIMKEKNFKKVKLCTVDGAQGDEADFVIVSTVRNNVGNHLGFLKVKSRLTVALSRSRNTMVVLGSERALSTDPVWKQVVNYGLDKTIRKDSRGKEIEHSADTRLFLLCD